MRKISKKNSAKSLSLADGKKINKWLISIGVRYLTWEDLDEYKEGQLLEASERLNSIIDWDEWQHLQICMGKEIPLDMALAINSMLWENDIEILELETEKSKKYSKKE